MSLPRIVLLLLLSLLSTACQSYFDATPRVWNDLAIMEDQQRFDLVHAAASDAQWIVAQITLQPNSHIPMGTMHPDGHMTVTLTVAGTCRILDPLGAKPDKMQFDFSFEGDMHFAGGGGFRGPPPFSLSDGPAILRWNPQATDKTMFPEGYRLPDPSWAPKVAEAWTIARQQQPLFDPAHVKSNLNALGGLANRGNPLLTIAAFRTLAQARVIAPSWGDYLIMNTPFPTQGVLLHDYLQSLPDASVDEVSAHFNSYLSNPRTVEEIEGFALAAPGINRVQSPAGHKVARAIMNNLGWRLPFLPGDPDIRAGLIGLSHRWTFSD